jgi:TetR/AcrR family transcriptional regulator, transcriptional repressor for nem operon
MRVSKETMAEHREQILAAAAARFRERGFDGISVAELMKEVGLTHGGFYGHFSSKEELMALAVSRAMSDAAARWQKVIDEAPGDPLGALAKHYLSMRHHDHPETGCLFATLGSELARQPASVRNAVTEGRTQFFDMTARIVPGPTRADRKKRAMAIVASMVGGMILARSVSDPELGLEILESVKASVASSVQEALASVRGSQF